MASTNRIKPKAHYVTATLDDIIRFWVEHYDLDGDELLYHDYWLDTAKREVVIELVVDEAEPDEAG